MQINIGILVLELALPPFFYMAVNLFVQIADRTGGHLTAPQRRGNILHSPERIEDNREELTELENCGVEALRHHSASLVRLIRPGMRLTPEEVHSAQMAELRARLAADEREVRKMQHALRSIGEDPYYLTIELKYFDNVKDADAALRLRCDPATVRRNRRRLVRRLALRLYGVECI